MMPDVDGLMLGRQIASDRELEHTAMVMLSSAGQRTRSASTKQASSR